MISVTASNQSAKYAGHYPMERTAMDVATVDPFGTMRRPF